MNKNDFAERPHLFPFLNCIITMSHRKGLKMMSSWCCSETRMIRLTVKSRFRKEQIWPEWELIMFWLSLFLLINKSEIIKNELLCFPFIRSITYISWSAVLQMGLMCQNLWRLSLSKTMIDHTSYYLLNMCRLSLHNVWLVFATRLLVQRKRKREEHTMLRREPQQKKSGCC